MSFNFFVDDRPLRYVYGLFLYACHGCRGVVLKKLWFNSRVNHYVLGKMSLLVRPKN